MGVPHHYGLPDEEPCVTATLSPPDETLPPPEPLPASPRGRRWLSGRRLLIVATIVVTVLAVLAAFNDLPAVGRALRGFDWRLLVPAVLLSTLMHGLRFTRWHLYVRRVTIAPVRVGDSALMYGGGLGTHLTPGRVGEAVRFIFLRRATGTPISRSSSILVAERLTDGIGLAAIAVPGVLALGTGSPWVALALVIPPLLLPVLISRRVHGGVATALTRLPYLGRFAGPVREAGAELRGLLAPWPLMIGVALSCAAVASEVAIFVLMLRGVGVELTSQGMLRAAFVLPAAMLASAIIIVPGNLGIAEGSLATLTKLTLAVAAGPAAAAAVLARLLTLWWGLALGAIALPCATRRWGKAVKAT